MTRNVSPQQRLSRIVCCLWLCLASGAVIGIENPVTAQSDNKCIACHSRQKERAGQVVFIYQTSTHGKMNVGCENCHGGDASQSEKLQAHAGRFIARPDTSATLEMCGRCHRQPLAYFTESRHFAIRPNVRRLDCVECHGVHGIGAASESFRWPQFCAGCHGLEYLPQLPRPFQEMLTLADDLGDGFHRLETKGRANTEFVQRRKEIRRMISELVHKTDSRSGVERIPRILESGATLKLRIAAEEKQ